MPETHDNKNFENALLTFGKVKEGSKDTFVRFIEPFSTMNVRFSTDDSKYHESPSGGLRMYSNAVVYSDGKFIGKIALITPYLHSVLSKFGETAQGHGFNDAKTGKFVVVRTTKLSSNKISYEVLSAVSKKPVTVDFSKITFPNIHTIITPENELGIAPSKRSNSEENDLFSVGAPSTDSPSKYRGAPQQEDDSDDVPF